MKREGVCEWGVEGCGVANPNFVQLGVKPSKSSKIAKNVVL